MHRKLLCLTLISCLTPLALLAESLPGLRPETRARIEALLAESMPPGTRKILVSDFDGTLIGQRPNYAGNEFFIDLVERGLVKNPPLPPLPGLSSEKGPVENFLALRKENPPLSYAWRTKALAGMPVEELRRRADLYLLRHYRKKIFAPMRSLVRRFLDAGWEVWVVTATTECIVDRFIEREFAIPANRVIGVRTIVRNGRITDELAGPVTDEEGKVVAIDTFIKARPQVVLGNSMGDVPMLKAARRLGLVVNPDPELRSLAKRHDWAIERMPDEVLPDAPHAYRRHGGWPTRDSEADARRSEDR